MFLPDSVPKLAPPRRSRTLPAGTVGRAVLATCLLPLLFGPAAAAERRPLLVENKRSLYQRVLTRPDARLLPAPGGSGGESVAPFSIFYVFGRRGEGAERLVEVGASPSAPPRGWIRESALIDWRQTIVVAFNNPAGRERGLLFRSREAALDTAGAEDAAERARRLREAAQRDQLPPDGPVVSIEPENHIDINRQFYVLPILRAEERRIRGRFNAKLLEVATVAKPDAAPAAPRPSREEALKAYRVGIDFVVDTTTSMGPYIARVREAVQRLQERIGRSAISERVRFGLVGFRQHPGASPGVGYHTKVFLPLDQEGTAPRFLDAIRGMAAATVPTRGFREDSLGGVQEGLSSARWDQFDGRYLILITDAGPRDTRDGLVRTPNMAVRQVADAVAARQVALFALHLKTQEGRADHDGAAGEYRALARFQNAAELYYPVEGGDVAAFGTTVDRLADDIVRQVQDAVDGRLARAEAAAPGADTRTSLVGLAMQLAYLGRRQETRAPDVFEAWLVDRDIADPRRQTLDVRVLLTKNQLATLRDVTQAIVEKGDASIQSLDATQFFAQLRSAVAAMARSPDRLVNAEFRDLGDALGEYLADLPYQSEMMRVDERRWNGMGGGEQRELVDRLKSKLKLYEAFHNDPGLWTAAAPGAPDGERVYALPIDAMP